MELCVALLALLGVAIAYLDGVGLAGISGPALFGLAGLAAAGDSDDDIGKLVEKIARVQRGEDDVSFDTDREDDVGHLYDAVGSLAADREGERYRLKLYHVASDPDLEGEEKVQRLLELGCERLGVENGHVVAVDPEEDRHEIQQTYGSDLVESGGVSDLGRTFCRKTVTADGVLSVADTAEAGYEDDHIFEQWGIGSYVGATVELGEDLYGTVCFVDADPRETAFTAEETDFVGLVARWVSQEVSRRARTAELHLQERALEAAPVGVTISDATRADNPIVYANSQFEAITGYPAAETTGRNCRFLQGEESTAEPVSKLREGIAAEEPVTTELRNYRRDGTRFWNRVSVSPVENVAGEVTNFVGFQEDVSEQKEREEQLRDTRNRLAEQNRTLQRLYEISADHEASFDEKMQQLLDLGRERLGTSGAFLSGIDRESDEFEFVHTSGSVEAISAGTVALFSETYCRKLVERGGLFEIVDAPTEGWADDPAYARWDLDTYFGAPVYVEGELEGTLAFVDSQPHGESLTDDQRTFVELATQWVSYELERRRQEREAIEQKEFTEDVLDALEDVFYVLDEEGTLSRWNDSLAAVTGYDDGEIRSMHALEFFAEADQKPVAEAIERVFETGTARVEARFLTKDGAAIPHEFVASAVEDPDGNRVLAGAGRDVTERKQRELALQSLQDATRGLLHTGSESEVAELVVDTAASLFDVPGIAVYTIDDASNQFAPLAYTDAFETLSEGAPAVDVGDDAVVWNCFASGERMVFDDAGDARQSRVFGEHVDTGLVVPMGDHGVFVVATDGDDIGENTRRLAETLVATTEAAFDRLASEADLRQRDAELEAQNERLRRQVGINDIIRRVDQSLVGATSREDVESAVCDRLVESDDVAFAWIGGLDGADGALVPRTWAGTGETYLDSLGLDQVEGADEPSLATANSGEATVVSNVVDGLREDGWRRGALASDFHSVVSVPLAVEDHSHGVLTVYAEEPEVFEELERTVFAELGQSIANAIDAVSAREALHSDTVVELTLQLPEPNGFLARVARDADCEVEHEGVSTRSGDETQLFFATTGAAADDVSTVLEELYAVTGFRLVSENDDGRCLFEATATGAVLPSALVDQGASPRSIFATPTGTEAVADLPTSTDVREFLELLQEEFPAAELRSRRNVERGMETRQQLLTSLFEGLTDRQLEVLRTAYFAGFFEWPRASTGEDVAEMLGVTQPTVNRHLRLGQQRLLAQLFAEEAPDIVPA